MFPFRYIESIVAKVCAATGRIAEPDAKISAALVALVNAATRRPELHHLLFQEAGIGEDDAFEPVRRVFVDLIRAHHTLRGTDTAIDFVMGGVHAALIRVAHSPKSTRRTMTAETVDLSLICLSRT